MPRNLLPDQRRLPLHIHISLMFTVLLLFTGVVLGIFNYRQTSQIILSSSETLFSAIAQDVEADINRTYQPIRQLLSLLAAYDLNYATTLEQRLALLKPFTQALQDDPNLASLYLGYNNGDFFMVRPLRTDTAKQSVQSPANASYQVWSIEHITGNPLPRSQSLFFDAALHLINKHENPKERFDPRDREWFKRAREGTDQITTEPYVFFSSHVLGTTLARRSGTDSVIAADLSLDALSATLAKHKATASTEVVVFDNDGNAVAYPDSSKLIIESGTAHLAKAKDLSPALNRLFQLGVDYSKRLTAGNREWIVAHSPLSEGGSSGLQMAMLVPADELLADAIRLRWQGALVALTTLLVCLPLGWVISRIMVKPLRELVSEADAIRGFDFTHPASHRSLVLEVDQLSLSMARMKATLVSFLRITASLSAETHFDTLLQKLLCETVTINQAQAGLIYLVNSESGYLEPSGLIVLGVQNEPQRYGIGAHDLNNRQLPGWLQQLITGKSSTVVALGFEQADDLQGLMQAIEAPRVHLLAIHLSNQHGETIGVLNLIHTDTGTRSDLEKISPERVAFTEAVSGAAAICIESQRLQARQKLLLDSFIQLIAGAIDAKSPYTGGHCQRVPVLTLMLARAAAASQQPAFLDFHPTEDEWETLHIAAWLHDCGKVTTPEYVVDKATKLETLHNRIHEIRTRFEVLKRDAWITYWQGLAMGGDSLELATTRDVELTELDDDFSFVACSNLGAEAMDDSDLHRLQQIAARSWMRTLDDRIGVSWEENNRQSRQPVTALPARETLLADRPEHLIERAEAEDIPADNPWGFKLDVPRYKFNHGELYNLSIRRGTLTHEERYIINHHMVQTILMLSRLPFPAHLKGVAEIAGGHHEKMDGTGYPKRLKRAEMSIAARMMAIADIFEALTAADRPYKKGKSLSEALSIMAQMCVDEHIDPPLFELFIQADIFQRYAESFLQPQQIDAVDKTSLLKKAGVESRN
ncbi:HD domain-containing phosphohydrolase [Pseudomonas sp. 10B1]|uniref:HD domain-containing phosphohydrolase n=2 Tax=Pseudomonas TaxID=286 RepID=UPI002AB5761A|nr:MULTISPECIES: HD domain-containing phosphohydrolase [unclassified Pseudomonas]MDY7560502.1 HD domain-containing phosphohydrolase [Pseudomonas sp. AB6]MEA9975904.1 HD domain-containing phosphohydrolase [Pseudomonas sp. RTS4]MEA9993259.1 HD domain-containing phosphohydrolase [Pseudomonas sp. AA4]MEB0088130.1 HD domain-containing phosphohydrolase [Pseudomonas sp. RTI1]MEB0124254.1 HD domain-containing phosphohydrolase [Pseudomonas sp. CCC1.2]